MDWQQQSIVKGRWEKKEGIETGNQTMKTFSTGIQNKNESVSISPKIYVSKLCLTLKIDCSEQMQYSTAQAVLQ